MKKKLIHTNALGINKSCALLLTVFFSLVSFSKMYATNYYVDNINGSNTNNGTSTGTAWFDFTNVNSRTFVAGDQVLLKSGCVWNQELHLKGSGTSTNFIVLDAYGTGNKPKIQRNNSAFDRTVYLDNNPSYVKVRNIEICNAGDGIRLIYTSKGNTSIYFENLYIHNIDTIVNGMPETPDQQFYSTGITVYNGTSSKPASSTDYVATDIRITNCEISFVTAPFTFMHQFTNPSGPNLESPWSYQNISIDNNSLHDFKGPASTRGMSNSFIKNNICRNGATVKLTQGTTGFFNFNLENVIFEGNIMDNILNTGSADQTWIDNEAYCNNVQVYGNFIKNTPGSGVEFLGLPPASSSPPRGTDDYNTNNIIDGNTFSNNASGALKVETYTAIPTGTASNNIYLTGNSFFTGNSSGFTLTNNNASSQSSANLALYKSYIASSNWDNTQRASKASDGSPGTNWQSASGSFTNEWLRINFGESITFDSVRLSEYENRTAGYRIEYSSDGVNWQTAYTGTTIGTSLAVSFAAVTAKMARLYFTSGANTPIIFEFEIYKKGGSGTNYIQNPSFDIDNFDTQTPTAWSTWTSSGTNYDADYTQTDNPRTGARNLAHWRNGSYDVYTYQNVNGLANGTYTATVYAKTIGSPSTCYIKAQSYGGADLITNISGGSYVKYTISNIQVTNGTCLIGVYTVGNQFTAAVFEDFTLSNNSSPFVNRVIRQPVTGNNTPVKKQLLYPNPSKGLVSVLYELPAASKATLLMYDISGKLVTQRNFISANANTGKIDVDAAGLNNGTYTIKIISGNHSTTQKLIIEK